MRLIATFIRRRLAFVAIALLLCGAGPGSLPQAAAQNCWSSGSTGVVQAPVSNSQPQGGSNAS